MFYFLNPVTHLFCMSVHFNNDIQRRHRLLVFPIALRSVAYCPRSCLDGSSCLFLLWTYSFLMLGTILVPIMVLVTVIVPSMLTRHFVSRMLPY
jgi:hypothetical protein